jgi:hypothetical protein
LVWLTASRENAKISIGVTHVPDGTFVASQTVTLFTLYLRIMLMIENDIIFCLLKHKIFWNWYIKLQNKLQYRTVQFVQWSRNIVMKVMKQQCLEWRSLTKPTSMQFPLMQRLSIGHTELFLHFSSSHFPWKHLNVGLEKILWHWVSLSQGLSRPTNVLGS